MIPTTATILGSAADTYIANIDLQVVITGQLQAIIN